MALVIALCTLSLNVLLNSINLTLVTNQTLLDLIQPVVDITLKNLVFARFMLHSTIINLLRELGLILFNHLSNQDEANFLLFELTGQIVNPHKLILHLVFHLVDALSHSFHLFIDTAFKVADLV